MTDLQRTTLTGAVSGTGALGAALGRRRNIVEMTALAEAAVLSPNDPGAWPHALRSAIAARIASLHGEAALAARFAEGADGRFASVADPAESGADAGLRFVDIDQDGRQDVLFSNESGYSAYLFESAETGWSRQLVVGKPGDEKAIPAIARNGTNNGAWFHDRHLYVQNEDTATMPDLEGVDVAIATDDRRPSDVAAELRVELDRRRGAGAGR